MTRQVRILLAELIGTMILVVGGVGTAVLAGEHVGQLGIAFAFGLSLLVIAYTFGQISGGHVNPAVTVGMVVAGKTDLKDAAWYIIGQFLGAFAGAAIIYLIANDLDTFSASDPPGGGPGFATNGWGDRSPDGYGFMPMVIAEVVMTALLLWAVLATTTRKFSAAAGGVTIGFALVLIHLISIPVTNTSVNPARSFGPAVFNGSDALAQFPMFIVFPIVGAVIAAFVWKALHEDDEPAPAPTRAHPAD